ncbi:hypothetical protein Taro_037096 [Colocasia esculenta]|uniref:Uncharacterized protein n=1 Tax=Colocasia esculenta TaxID=4460 RepID=A0A843W4T6_COLES|nr:hypothetical protein [Colocasia esculenta]
MSFLMPLDSLHMGEPTRIDNELKKSLKIAYEGKEMRVVADEVKVIDLHVPKLTADWFSRKEYEEFREDLQGKRIHIDAQSASTSKRKFDVPISLRDFVMKDLNQKWRSWKYDLRTKFFTPYQKAQQHFACSDTRKRNEINKQNKSKHTFFHCAGSKSFVDIYQEVDSLAGRRVRILNFSGQVVVSGILMSNDNDNVVMGKKLGGEYYEVSELSP